MIQQSTLQFIPFRSRLDEGWAQAWKLYENSFPACERWDESAYDRAFDDPLFEADAIRYEGELAGILFHWRSDGFHYVEHLAISPRLRGRNLGSRALGTFCRDKRVILEIDPPEDDISVRRLRFYERLGFAANPHNYIHPSFRKPFQHHRLVLMSRPGLLADDEARRFADFIREHVLHYSEHEHPELPRID